MCGIFGEVSFRPGGIDRDLLVRATEIVRHRGPDGFGYLAWDRGTGRAAPCSDPRERPGAPRVGLGHRRLSIIDLSGAAGQPMGTPEGDLWIVYNGEIFNYIELREELRGRGHLFRTASDTEVILHAYREWGAECLARFNGMWAFGLLDVAGDRLFCARDRMGVKPFYYTWDGERFLFASEIKQLLEAPAVTRDPDPGPAFDYLVHGVLDHSERTLYKDIRQLRGGHCLFVGLADADRSLRVSRYWAVDPRHRTEGLDEAASARRFLDLFTDAARIRLRSDVPVGSCLSGGLDSSSIVCVVNRLLEGASATGRQNTFSSRFGDARYDEGRFIDAVESRTGVRRHDVFPRQEGVFEELPALMWHQDEPFASTSLYAQWCVFRRARETGVKVMLDGQGADELLGGYHTFFPPRMADLACRGDRKGLADTVRDLRVLHGKGLSDLLRSCASAVVTPRTPGYHLARRLLGFRDRDILEADFIREGERESEYMKLPRADAGSRLGSALHESFFHTSLPALLHYEDRNSMAHSVEARVPFLDYRLVEFAFSLSDDRKIRGGETKVVLRKAMAGLLPEEVRLRRDKMGFVTPEEAWLKGPLRAAWLSRAGCLPVPPFRREAAVRHVERVAEGRKPFSFAPWRWIAFAAWRESGKERRG